MCDTKDCTDEARHERTVFGTTYKLCSRCHEAVSSDTRRARSQRQLDRSRSYSNAVRNYNH